MTTVIADFEKRVQEIESYFSLLESIEIKNAALYFPNRRSNKIVVPDSELTKVLKASLFLLLYNLVESSIKQSLAELYDGITKKGIRYKDVIDQIKIIWINKNHKNFNNKGSKDIFSAINGLAEEIISIKFDTEKIISGNIDGRKIREFSAAHGFSEKTHKLANNGLALFQVKEQRNNLAHGVISFAECGRNYTISDLRDSKKEVIKYLRSILKNIERYLEKEMFVA